jgi:hypothetical protein
MNMRSKIPNEPAHPHGPQGSASHPPRQAPALHLPAAGDEAHQALDQLNALRQHGLLVLLAPHAAAEVALLLAAHLARRGQVRVLDGGNRFNAYLLTRMLGRLAAPGENFRRWLDNATVSRAFTCFQMAGLLECTPSLSTPTLVLDALSTFYDENVSLFERRRLVRSSLGHLRRLSQRTVVVVSLRPPPPPKVDACGFLEVIQAAADLVWLQEEITPAAQLRLL